MPGFSPLRAGLVLAVLACALAGMSARVAYLETYGRQRLIRSADRQQHTAEVALARRGSVFDHTGIQMAGTVQTLAAYIDPHFLLEQYQKDGKDLNEMDVELAKLAKIIECKPDELNRLVSEHQDSRYLRIAEQLDERTGQEVLKLNIPGVGVQPVCVRFYPMGDIAAHVLGSVGADGHGLEGMELKYDKLLTGRDGYKRIEKDARKRPIGVDAEDYIPPLHGQHLVLTLDTNIQMLAEEELAAACVKHKAKRGEVVIMDPHNGDVLAMASWPTFSPQNVTESGAEERLNRCLVVPYEPGSTLKPFIMGPALNANITHVNEVWPIHAITYVAPYGRRVTDVHFYGPLSSWDVLVKSSNIGMSMLAERMGNAALHKALTSFGFGRRTGIEMPAEDPGLLQPLHKWTRYSTESVAQGYEMMVTPMQLCRAFCTYANGGHLVQPRIVNGVLSADGKVIPQAKPVSLESTPQIINPDTAMLVKQVLSDVVVRGTGTKARSKYWNFFGKTGTAHVVPKGAHTYASNLFNSSFIGGAPLENPRIVIAFIIHEPDRSLGYYGGTVSGPAAGRLLERVLAYLQTPESPALQPPPAYVTATLQNFNPKLYGEEEPRMASH